MYRSKLGGIVVLFIAMALALLGQVVPPSDGPGVTDGLRLWLRADSGITKDSTNHVSEWVDLSGRATHFTQGDLSRQPVWVGTDLGGKAAVQFDGSSRILKSASTDLQAGSADFTLVAVVRPASTQGNN